MAESGIDKIGVNLVDATFEANVTPSQVSIWSLGCDIEINDVDATIQEVKVNDIVLSGNIATDSLEVDITTTKTNVMDIDVNVALGGIHSTVVESQVVSYDKIKDITEISPEAVNEPRYAASALSVKGTYDSLTDLYTKLKILEAKVENGNSGGGGGFPQDMWYYGDDGRLYTTKDVVVLGNLGVGGPGLGGNGEGAQVVTALSELTDVSIYNPKAGEILVYENGKWINKVFSVDIPVMPDLEGYATEAWVERQGYVKAADIADPLSKIETFSEWFEWADEEHTTIRTKYNFFSQKQIAVGEKGEADTPASGGGITGIQVNGNIYTDADEFGIIALPNYPTELRWESVTGRPTKLTDFENDLNLSAYAGRQYVDDTFYTKAAAIVLSQGLTASQEAIDKLNVLLEWFKYDSVNDAVYTDKSFYSKLQLAAGERGENASAGGGTITGIRVNGKDYASPDEYGILTIPDYPTSLTWDDITGKPTDLGQFTNEAGYITSNTLEGYGYATKAWVEAKQYALASNVYDKDAINQKEKNLSDRIAPFEKWFREDSAGNLYTTYNFYSTKQLATGEAGAAHEGEGGGGRVNGIIINGTEYVEVDNYGNLIVSETLATLDDLASYLKNTDADNKFATKTYVNDTFATITSLGGVDERLKEIEEYFNGSGEDADNKINKWNEIVAFLNATEDTTLAGILAAYTLKTDHNALAERVTANEGAISGINTTLGSHTSTLSEHTTAINTLGTKVNPIDTWFNEVGKFFKKDSDGVWYVDGSFYTKGQNAAGAVGSPDGGGSSGSGVMLLESWSDVPSSLSGYALSAALGIDLHERFNNYYTIGDVDNRFSGINSRLATLDSGVADRYTKAESDGRYLKLSGGALTGKLNMNSARISMGHQVIEMGSGMLGAYNPDTPHMLYWYNGEGFQGILHAGNYSDYALPLSGGTIRSASLSPLSIDRDSDTGAAAIGYARKNAILGFLGFNDTTGPKWFDIAYTEYHLIHSGNIGSQSVASAQTLKNSNGTVGATAESSGLVSFASHIVPNNDSQAYVGVANKAWYAVYTNGLWAPSGKTLYLGANNSNHITVNTSGNVTINKSLSVSSTSTFSGLTTHNSGISTPHITIGGITISVVDGVLRIDGNVYTTGQLGVGAVGQEGGGTGGGGVLLLNTWPTDGGSYAGYALGGNLGIDLNTRVKTLEGKATAVSFSQTLTSGKQIGVLTIDGSSSVLYAPSTYAWSEITSRPSKLSDFTDDVVAGKYLPLTGGTMKKGSTRNYLFLDTDSADGAPYITFQQSGSNRVYIGHSASAGAFIQEGSGGTSILTLKDGVAKVGENDIITSAGGTIKRDNVRNPLAIDTSDSTGAYLVFRANGSNASFVGYDSSLGALLQNAQTSTRLYVGSHKAYLDWGGSNVYTILHTGNANKADVPWTASNILFPTGTSATWNIHSTNAYKGITVLNAVQAKPEGAPDHYAVGLSVSGYYGFTLASLGGGDVLLYRRKEGLDWKTVAFTDSNVASADYASNAGTLSGVSLSSGSNTPWGTIPMITEGGWMDVGKHFEFHYDNTTGSDFSTVLSCTGNYGNFVSLPSASGTLALLTDNVASATKLATARTLWGQSFDGTGDVDGNISTSGEVFLNHNKAIRMKGSNGTDYNVLFTSGTDLNIGYDSPVIRFGGSKMFINSSGVGIGTTSPAYKLDVAGTARISGATTLSSTLSVSGLVTASSGIKIGSILLTDENGTLKIAGNAYTTGQLGAGEAGQPTSGGGSAILDYDSIVDALGFTPASSSQLTTLTNRVASLERKQQWELDSNGVAFTTDAGMVVPLGTPHILGLDDSGQCDLTVGDGSYVTRLYGSSILVNGSEVLTKANTSFTRNYSSGTKIGTIKIGGVSTDIYAPASGSSSLWTTEYDITVGTEVLFGSKEYIGTNTIVGWDSAGLCVNDLYIGYDGYTIWMQGSVDEASDMRLKTVIDAVNLDIRDIAFAPIFNYVFKSRPQGRQMLGSSAQYWQTIAPCAVSENDKGNLAMNYGAIALASVVAVAKKTLTHEEEIAELKLKVQSLENRLAKYELN